MNFTNTMINKMKFVNFHDEITRHQSCKHSKYWTHVWYTKSDQIKFIWWFWTEYHKQSLKIIHSWEDVIIQKHEVNQNAENLMVLLPIPVNIYFNFSGFWSYFSYRFRDSNVKLQNLEYRWISLLHCSRAFWRMSSFELGL